MDSLQCIRSHGYRRGPIAGVVTREESLLPSLTVDGTLRHVRPMSDISKAKIALLLSIVFLCFVGVFDCFCFFSFSTFVC